MVIHLEPYIGLLQAGDMEELHPSLILYVLAGIFAVCFILLIWRCIRGPHMSPQQLIDPDDFG
jgi:hypothetical protein